MQGYRAAVIGKEGSPLGGVTVTVYKAGTLTLATIYADKDRTAKSNPFTSDDNGTYEFYADNQRVDVVLAKTGNTFDANDTKDILLYDPSDAVGGSIFGQNVYVRSHPESDQAARKGMIVKADRLILESTVDGSLVNTTAWDRVVADLNASGAGGLCAGCTLVANAWYELWAIRKSSDGTKSAFWHRAKDWFLDESFTTVSANGNLRDASARTRIGQGIKVDTTGPVPFIDLNVAKVGTPTGNVWITLESDSGGSPSGTVLATSDKMDVASFSTTQSFVRFIFRNPATLTATTQYHIVMYGDFTISGTNFFRWWGENANNYANGVAKQFDGVSTWSALSGVLDLSLKVYVERTYTFTMPTGYDQKMLVEYGKTDGSSNLIPFESFNRRVRFLADLSFGTDTNTTPILRDWSPFMPPIPCLVRLTGAHSVGSSTRVVAAGVPLGYAATQSSNGNQLSIGLSQTADSSQPHTDMSDDVWTEYQGLYTWGGTGTHRMYANGYEW